LLSIFSRRSCLVPFLTPFGLPEPSLLPPCFIFVSFFNYQFLQDQNLAVNFDGGDVSHRCLARKDLRLPGIDFFIDKFGSPYRINFTCLPFFASTANFLDLPGVRFGLL
jgi:hypothetical protein